MRIDAAFPSQYIKAADLHGKRVRVVMSHVNIEEVGGEHKPVLYFQGKDRGMVLNKTNANNIANMFGFDTDHWTGNSLELFEAMVDFQGRTVAAIRVQPIRQQQTAPASQPPTNSQRAMQQDTGRPDDEVPF